MMADEELASDLENNILELKTILGDDLTIPAMDDDRPPKAEAVYAKIWAYMGACGGVGVTSLAIQTAYSLANTPSKNHKVCLVDLDFERSSVAASLDMVPSVTIADLNAANGRMDEALCMQFVQNYDNLFSVVCAQGELGGNEQIEAGALMALLDDLSTLYDFIILDVPQMWRPWTQAIIGVVDKFAIITEMRVPTLHHTRALSSNIVDRLDLDQKPDVIINKYERRSFRDSLFVQDAQKVLDRDDVGEICVDNETLQAALNCGVPAGKAQPNSRYTKAVDKHVNSWQGIAVQEEKNVHRKWRRRARSA